MLSEELTSVELKKGEFLDQSLLIDGQAPKNEKELVALFASLSSSHLGFSIRKIRRRFPDCIAYRGGQRLRIEFEFQSRNVKEGSQLQNLHDPGRTRDLDGTLLPPAASLVFLRGSSKFTALVTGFD